MRALVLAIILVAGAVWLYHHHTTTDSQVCVETPARVCVDRPTSTRHR